MLLASKSLIKLLRIYQICISPLIKPRCRFHITCSQYGIEVINKFGILKGGWMFLTRILKCHPFTKTY